MPEAAFRSRVAKKRLFFALWPDSALRDQIAAAAADCMFSGRQMRPVPAANYHLTLAFLGGISPASIADIIAAGRGTGFAGFEVTLQVFGYWPRSQVAWLGPNGLLQPLMTLADNLANRLAQFGFAVDNSQFRPHVTLARDVEQASVPQLAEPVRWPVRSFALLESIAGSDGPVYTLLQEFSAWD